MKYAFFTMGLPACGKSTFIRRCFPYNCIIDPDECSGETHEEQIKHSIERLNKFIEQKNSFVFLSTGQNAKFIETLHYLKANGYYVTILYFKSNYKECLHRNQQRERKVPNFNKVWNQIKDNLIICKSVANEFVTLNIKIN